MSKLKTHLTKKVINQDGTLIWLTFCNRVGMKKTSTYIKDITCLVCQHQYEQAYYESTGYRKKNPPKYNWPKESK